MTLFCNVNFCGVFFFFFFCVTKWQILYIWLLYIYMYIVVLCEIFGIIFPKTGLSVYIMVYVQKVLGLSLRKTTYKYIKQISPVWDQWSYRQKPSSDQINNQFTANLIIKYWIGKCFHLTSNKESPHLHLHYQSETDFSRDGPRAEHCVSVV